MKRWRSASSYSASGAAWVAAAWLCKLPALSDNSGAESVCYKLYTSKVPLDLFVRKLSVWSSLTGIRLECSHISGEKNEDADTLSRWDGAESVPPRFAASDLFEVSLQAFWNIQFQVQLFARDQHLLWPLPPAHTLGPSMSASSLTSLSYMGFGCSEVSACLGIVSLLFAPQFPKTRFGQRPDGSEKADGHFPASRNKRSASVDDFGISALLVLLQLTVPHTALVAIRRLRGV